MMATNHVKGTDAIDERTLSAEGVVARMWFALVSSTRPYDQLFEPATWSRCGKLSTYDLVRCRAVDGRYDVILTVAMKTSSGARMEFVSGRPPLTESAAA
jgi:hypothetical protein